MKIPKLQVQIAIYLCIIGVRDFNKSNIREE